MSRTNLDRAIEALRDAPTVNIKGKQYTQVATRVEVFRRHFDTDWSLVTEILPVEHPMVRVRAEIRNPDGAVIATGTAEENRTYGINKTSAIENCETSAIGRALANLGLHGGEFATAEEVDTAIKGQQEMEETADTKAKTKLQSDMRAFDRDLQRVSDTAELEGLLKSYEKTLTAAKNRADMREWVFGGPDDVMGAEARIVAKRKELETAEREGPQEPRGSPQNDGPAWGTFVRGAEELMSKAQDLDAVKDFWSKNGKHIAALPEEAVDRLTAAKDAAKERLSK